MAKIVLFVARDGTIEGLHSSFIDKLPCHKTVTRASVVEYDEQEQMWQADISYADEPLRIVGKSRSALLAIENMVVLSRIREKIRRQS